LGKYLDIIRSAVLYDQNDINDQSRFGRLCRFGRTFLELEHRCPDHIDFRDWNRAVEDARRFLAQWGEQAEALGWTAQDLFGLHRREQPKPSYRRLSRYDVAGLIWLLHGRPVVALSTNTAAIKNPTGAILVYRKAL
jgi:hypothetical protein